MTYSRRQAREWAVQMLTTADLNPPEDIPAFIAAFWNQVSDLDEVEGGCTEVPDKFKKFAEERVTGVLTNQTAIDEVLTANLANWDLYRLGTVERCVLRLGVWELKYTDVPPPVVINEAIDLANWFASPKSKTLVNGLLDKLAKQPK